MSGWSWWLAAWLFTGPGKAVEPTHTAGASGPEREDAPEIVDSPFEALETSCLEQRQAPACMAAAQAWLRGPTGGRPDPAQADGLFRAACTFGEPAGCMEAAALYLSASVGMRIEMPGSVLTADVGQAATLLGSACQAGRLDACGLLGDLLANPSSLLQSTTAVARGLKPDVIAARQAWTDGCPESGDAPRDLRACVRLAAVYREGQGLPRDPERAAIYAAHACKLPGGARWCAAP